MKFLDEHDSLRLFLSISYILIIMICGAVTILFSINYLFNHSLGDELLDIFPFLIITIISWVFIIYGIIKIIIIGRMFQW